MQCELGVEMVSLLTEELCLCNGGKGRDAHPVPDLQM
jgi:hypothetical protein